MFLRAKTSGDLFVQINANDGEGLYAQAKGKQPNRCSARLCERYKTHEDLSQFAWIRPSQRSMCAPPIKRRPRSRLKCSPSEECASVTETSSFLRSKEEEGEGTIKLFVRQAKGTKEGVTLAKGGAIKSSIQFIVAKYMSLQTGVHYRCTAPTSGNC